MNKAFVFHKKEMDPFGKAVTFEVNDYSLVAIVDVEEDAHFKANLEYIYQVTNHIEENWTLNDNGVYALGNKQRSTSVGDVIVLGDKSYLCASVGWKEVPMI